MESDTQDDLREWRKLWYQEAEADVRWAKERSWSIMYYALLLLGALFAAYSSGIGGILSQSAYLWAIGITVAVTLAWLFDLQQFAARARAAVDRYLKPFPKAERYPGPRGLDKDHYVHLIVQSTIVAASGAALVGGEIAPSVAYGDWAPYWVPIGAGVVLALGKRFLSSRPVEE